MEPVDTMPHSQELSNNPYPEPIIINNKYNNKHFKNTIWKVKEPRFLASEHAVAYNECYEWLNIAANSSLRSQTGGKRDKSQLLCV